MTCSEEQYVLDHISRALLRVNVERAHTALADAAKCDSPIEGAFAAWFSILKEQRGAEFSLVPQYSVEVRGSRYRLDFAARQRFGASYSAPDALRVAIELDGHDFHERTREQVAKRNSRDRDLAFAGWTVFHFFGSEFHRDPEHCVWSIMLEVDARILGARRGGAHD